MDKQCSKCGVIKNINDFYKSQRGTKCRECTLQIGREYKKNKRNEKQNGLCYWFKIPLTPSTGKKHPQQPSLDRLDRNKGYTKDNVVLTCYAANIGRNENDVETWSEFLNVLFQKK